ncbi:MAG: FtsX-like permease family protein, partial [Cetobacterium sp.]
NGVSISLNSYNEDFIRNYGYEVKEYGYLFIKGREPQNENEIVIEEKALKEMNLENKLNQIIDFNVIKKYTNEKEENLIYSKNKQFKLVGIIKKPDGYYENNDYYKVKAFVKANEENNIIPKELVSYNGILKFNKATPSMSLTNKKIGQYNLNQYDFMINVNLIQVLDDYKMSKETAFSKNNKLLPMMAAGLVIYNIFNMILIEMTKQIGMLRAIGLSKRKVKYILFIQGLIVLIVGLIAGFIIGSFISILGLSLIYGEFTELYISKDSIVEPIIMASVSVLLSMIFIIYKSSKITPMEAIRNVNKGNKDEKNRFYHKMIKKAFGITGEMAFKNVFRNKSRVWLTVLSISLAGMLFITNMAVYKTQDDGSTSMLNMSMGDLDIVINNNFNNTDENFVNYDKKYIDEISKIKEIEQLQKSINSNGYINVKTKDLDEDYKKYYVKNKEKDNLEISMAIKGFDYNYLKRMDKYIEDGVNIMNSTDEEYPSVLVSNNHYSVYTSSNDAKLLKDIKINDLIDIKVPVKEDGELKYENKKVKVAGILNKDYVVEEYGGLGSDFQVILNQKDYKELTNMENYNNIALKIKSGSDEKVIKKIEKISENSSFLDIESNYKNKNYYSTQTEKNKKAVLTSVILILLISSINIICIIRTNIIIRMNEIATLRSIGMSMKKVKNMIIKESLIYGILSILVSSIIGTIKYFKYIKMVNLHQLQGFGKENVMPYNIPFAEILQFSIATILICLVTVYLSKNKIEKLSIVEGLKNNE